MTNETMKPEALRSSIESVRHVDKHLELSIRLTNEADRALHYISDVRAIRYDAPSRRLTVALSDEGRQVIPGAIEKTPLFRHLDPRSDAELMIRVPERIVKLSRTANPGKLAFEKHQLTDVAELVIEVAWSDVPFYKDTRASARDDPRLPAVRWQQFTARASRMLSTPL